MTVSVAAVVVDEQPPVPKTAWNWAPLTNGETPAVPVSVVLVAPPMSVKPEPVSPATEPEASCSPIRLPTR